MSREIKFRAWHKEAREMLYGDNILIFRWLEREHQPIELMQFTGLKDKNGKEIYEGDILDNKFQIQWNQLHCGWALFNKKGFCHELLADEYDDIGNQLTPWQINGEIIGNIYENPELIK